MNFNPHDFWEKYELINSSNILPNLKNKSEVCRYCSKSSPEASFLQKTHLIPEFLGKNDILTYDECDSCNKLFSKYESNFSIFILPYLTLLGIKGKRRIPSFQSRTNNRNEKTRTSMKHRGDTTKELHIELLDDYEINPDTKSASIIFRKPPFVPSKVYKSILKIGLSLLPPSYDQYNQVSFAYLTNRTLNLNFITYAFITTLKTTKFKSPCADLYRAKYLVKGKEEYPEHTLVLCFANQVIQIFLPFSEELKIIHRPERHLILNLYPGFGYESIRAKTHSIKYYNFGIDTAITENHQINFSYEDAELNIPPKNQ